MFHIGVYNEQQHQQFCCETGTFALREESDGCWRPVWDEEQQQATGDLRFSVAENTATFEAVTPGWQLATGDALQTGVTAPMPCLLLRGKT